ncbi:deoxyguanosinetriphosphate triphosphohydrolase [Granulicatella seriolae]|uniref:Deoxyguanosinetriphosphate triphosphohydrolase n=1 Tax=Granulicatella seriolae TaxID=2967226 RepID=A0ABT1WL71_9LACT|nr:deoxyguanosinetriphosphate triphosphohydrolase [Granulicatella seriolae]
MEWKKLLSNQRLSGKVGPYRNEFDDDYKRIITSPAFRRLQDKTQVFPLERNDFIHTRLTHSLEVAMIGRSLVKDIVAGLEEELATKANSHLTQSKLEMVEHVDEIARIIECAGLLHDIGNPPYGHFGEDSIRQWFKLRLPKFLPKDDPISKQLLDSPFIHDLYNFDGNAQTLRTITKLHEFKGVFDGMDLTMATMNSIIKYTRLSDQEPGKDIASKKMGYFYAERDIYERISQATGAVNVRHPLTFILEAADDIAYLVADIEDAINKGILRFSDVRKALLENLTEDTNKALFSVQIRQLLDDSYRDDFSINRFFVELRNKLTSSAQHSFIQHYGDIMEGTYQEDLFYQSWAADLYNCLREISTNYIYDHKNVLRLEISGYTTLTSLLETFIPPLIKYDTGATLSYVDQKLIKLISDSQKASYHYFSQHKTPVEKLYLRMLLATDFISGMTDSYAQNLYLNLQGIK